MLQRRRRVIAAKIEAVEGVAEAITVADGGILVSEPTFSLDFEKVSRNIVTASLSKYNDLIGKTAAKVSFKYEFKGSPDGLAYSASNVPALSQYLRACGYAETVDTTPSSENVAYDPASSGVPSITLWLYEDGLIKKIRGARGNFSVSGSDGGNVIFSFEFTGVFDGVVDGALISPTYEATVPPQLKNAPFSYDSVSTFVKSSFTFDQNNTVTLREDFSNAEGYVSAVITDRDPRLKVDPEMELVATYDFHGKMLSHNQASLSIGDIGSVQYNKGKITAPKAMITGFNEAERAGIEVADLELQLCRDTGDDEVQFLFS